MPAWTDTTDREMLLSIITVIAPSVSKANCQSAADILGEGYTGESVRQRLMKVRKAAAAAAGTTTTASGDANTGSANGEDGLPKTPAKAKKTPQKKAAGEGNATPGSKRKAKATSVPAEDEDDEGGSPSKKMKVKNEDPDLD